MNFVNQIFLDSIVDKIFSMVDYKIEEISRVSFFESSINSGEKNILLDTPYDYVRAYSQQEKEYIKQENIELLSAVNNNLRVDSPRIGNLVEISSIETRINFDQLMVIFNDIVKDMVEKKRSVVGIMVQINNDFFTINRFNLPLIFSQLRKKRKTRIYIYHIDKKSVKHFVMNDENLVPQFNDNIIHEKMKNVFSVFNSTENTFSGKMVIPRDFKISISKTQEMSIFSDSFFSINFFGKKENIESERDIRSALNVDQYSVIPFRSYILRSLRMPATGFMANFSVLFGNYYHPNARRNFSSFCTGSNSDPYSMNGRKRLGHLNYTSALVSPNSGNETNFIKLLPFVESLYFNMDTVQYVNGLVEHFKKHGFFDFFYEFIGSSNEGEKLDIEIDFPKYESVKNIISHKDYMKHIVQVYEKIESGNDIEYIIPKIENGSSADIATEAFIEAFSFIKTDISEFLLEKLKLTDKVFFGSLDDLRKSYIFQRNIFFFKINDYELGGKTYREAISKDGVISASKIFSPLSVKNHINAILANLDNEQENKGDYFGIEPLTPEEEQTPEEESPTLEEQTLGEDETPEEEQDSDWV